MAKHDNVEHDIINLSPSFMIGHIKIGSIESASCLNMGNNFPSSFKSEKKTNQGFGSVSGDNNSLEDISGLVSDFKDFFPKKDKKSSSVSNF